MNKQMFGCHWVVWYYVRMLIYFDECYDCNHSYLVLGALYNPNVRKVHEDFLKRKRDERYFKTDGTVQEIKYNYCVNNKRLHVAKGAVDCFKESSSFFRAIVIDQHPQSGFNLNFFGRPDEPKSIKDARAYKKFTELLLKSNITITN